MPKVAGVYRDGKGGWYFKVRTSKDVTTGKWKQVTRRGFKTASEAGRERQLVLDELEAAPAKPQTTLSVTELVSHYLDDAAATGKFSAKTLFDYRHYLVDYIDPWIGDLPIGDLDARTVVEWQRNLATSGRVKSGKGLAPNTIRLARSPLNGAVKQAVTMGILPINPLLSVPRPTPKRSIPRHWSPEQAREFIALHEGDRLLPLWVFLLSSGLRIGEVVALRWPNVDLDSRHVRVNEFATVLGYEVQSSTGKSTDAVRTVDIDDHLIRLLRTHRKVQAEEELAVADYDVTDYVFTKPAGGAYHPQFLSRLLGTISVEVGLPRLTAHGLRHTSATLMLARGVAPKVAAERLGHADASLFSNLYSHVTPTMQRDAATQIGDALFGD